MSAADELLSTVYFHELEMRDRISNRLHLNIAVYASFFTVTAYMLRMMDYGSHPTGLTLFYTGITLSLFFMIQSGYKTAISLTGFEYRTLPKAMEILSFRQELEKAKTERSEYNQKYGLNCDIPNPEEDTKRFIAGITAKCIDYNYDINEVRRVGTKLATKYIIMALFPLALAATVFVGFDLDASSPRKNLLTQDTALSEQVKSLNANLAALDRLNHQKDLSMSDNDKDVSTRNAPPPPPPPLPKEPVWQVSTEDFKVEIPQRPEILRESK